MDPDLTRVFVVDVERDLAALGDPGAVEAEAQLAALRASWGRLVQHLALGPAPELRTCPSCGGVIRKAATRCMHCWAKSLAPDEPSLASKEPA